MASDEQFLRTNSPGMSYGEIASALGRTPHAVKNKSLLMGLLRPDRPRLFTAEEDTYLRENFESLQIGEAAAHLGRHVESIRGRSRILGLVNQATEHCRAVRATVRHDYFSEINAPVKAYVLGLMASDGTVSSADNGVGIKAKLADADMVRFLRDELSPKSKIGKYVLAPLPGYTAERPYAMFSVGSARMKADLAKYGITPRKTFTIWWPHLPEHLIAAFVLGCFDGDGCLRTGPYFSDWRWDLYSASEGFLDDAREAIRRHTGLEAYKMASKRGLHCLRLYGRAVATIDAWVHADVAGMTRKRLSLDAYDNAIRAMNAGRAAAGCKRSMAGRFPEKLQRAREMQAGGCSVAEIVSEIGVSSSTVYRWVRQDLPASA